MEKYESGKVSNKGVVVIPKAVRKHLNIEEGDSLEFVIKESETQLYVIKKKSILDAYGIIKSDRGIPSMDTIRKVVKEERSAELASERSEKYE